MESLKKDIQSIRSDCFALQREFETQITQLYAQINAVEKKFQQSLIQKEEIKKEITEVKQSIVENTTKVDDFTLSSKKEEKTPENITPLKEIENKTQAPEDFSFTPKEEVILPKKETINYTKLYSNTPTDKKEEVKQIVEKSKPQEATIKKKKVKKIVPPVEPTSSLLRENPFTQLLVDMFFPPFRELTGYFTKTYTNYKEENKLPVFFMTLTGIVIMLFGFGFLAQYAVVNYISEFNSWAKLGLGTILTSGVILWATRLVSKSERFREFGSSLIGLAIITNYLFIYFLSDTYLGFSALEGFCLIVANTGIALWLALRFETRIVAVLSLIGGACIPFYMPFDSLGEGGVTELYFYFIFLFILTISAVYTAHKIKWDTLKNVAFYTALGMIEYLVFFSEVFPHKGIYVIIFHAFAYLFFFISLWDGKQLKHNLDRSAVFMISANIGLFITNLFLLYQSNANVGAPINYNVLGTIYLMNVLPVLVVLIVYYQKLTKELCLLLFVVMGVFVAVAIPSLLNAELMGITWGIEACILLYCGFRFNFSEVRGEAYLLLLLSLGKIVFITIFGSWNWSTDLFQMGYWNMIAFGLILFAVILIVKFARPKDVEMTSQEKLFVYVLIEIEALWTALVFFSTLGYFYEEWVFVFALPYFLGMIYLSNERPFVLRVTELWSMTGIFICIGLSYATSIDDISKLDYMYNGNWSMFKFSSQTLLGKVAMIEFLMVLWGMQFFYAKTHPTSIWAEISKGLRILFYVLVPFLVLNIGNKISSDYVVTFSWLSVVVSFVLYEFIQKNKVLLTMFYLWIVGASVMTIGFFVWKSNHYVHFESTVALLAGFIVLVGVYLYDIKLQKEENSTNAYGVSNAYLYHYIAIFIGLMCALPFDLNEAIVALIITTYYLVLVVLITKDKIAVLKSSKMVLHRLVLIVLTFQFVILLDTSPQVLDRFIWGILVFGNIVTLLYLTYKENTFYSIRNLLWKIDMYWMQIILLIFYWVVSVAIIGNEMNVLFTILLFVHGITLLFTSLKDYKILKGAYISLFVIALLKLFLIDLADFALVEKVIAFIVIGGILLGSSFLFLKFKKD